MTRRLLLASLAAFATAGAAQLDVPYVRQVKDGCGAAVAAMVLGYWDRAAANPEELHRELFSPERGGTLASALRDAFVRRGYHALAFTGSQADLEEHVGRGRPLIVSLRPKAGAPLHYVVVAGVQAGAILLHDPARGPLLAVKREAFDRQWSAAGRWLLLAVPRSA
ncbi:MAG: C39 family peptidase [Bryobacterales bacterium]|nr:C39 family peptidase [Bryobacterales bacterium]